MTCSSTCPTPGAHANLGECLRSKGVAVTYCNSAAGRDLTAAKKLDRDLDAYAAARAEGIQPAGTNRQAVEDAKILSDLSGRAFQA